MDEKKLEEIKTGSECMFSGRLLHVFRDSVTLPDGSSSAREYIRHNGAVGIVAVDDNNNVIVERQFRYPFGKVITEIPAGKLDSAEEDHLAAAKRELREETGFTADNWYFLGSYYPAAAYSSETVWLYLAKGLHAGAQQLDAGEFLNYSFVPLDELVKDVLEDKIPDGKSQAGILRAAAVL